MVEVWFQQELNYFCLYRYRLSSSFKTDLLAAIRCHYPRSEIMSSEKIKLQDVESENICVM